MKKVFIILGICLATALCAFAAWPVEVEEVQHSHSAYCSHSDSDSSVSWTVNDSCEACKIYPANSSTPGDFKCGKCGGFLKSHYDKTSNGTVYYTYTCQKCSHSVAVSCKP